MDSRLAPTVSTAARSWPLPLAASLAMVPIVGAVDYATGLDVSVTLLYLAPICWCAWRVGRGAGLVVAAVCALAWLGAELLERGPIYQPWVMGWNTLMTLGMGADYSSRSSRST